MAILESYLFPTLEAGPSRVFNICAKTRELLRASKADPEAQTKQDDTPNLVFASDSTDHELLFRTDYLNRLIVVKEAHAIRSNPRYGGKRISVGTKPIGTKLYFPYDTENIYGGGQSIFADSTNLECVLADHAGFQDTGINEGSARDLQIIECLDNVPSLDPFLVKDKLDIEGIKVNDHYFNIPHEEWQDIQKFVSDKFKPIISFVFPNNKNEDHRRAKILINKLWNTKDLDSLMPIVEAFDLPIDEASGIFSAWKGILYYDYEYSKSIEDWKICLEWLTNCTSPTDFVDNERKSFLLMLVKKVRDQYREAWKELKSILDSYHRSYDLLFVNRQSPDPFIKFMRNAVKSYWVLGSRMSAIHHSVSVWEILTSDWPARRLKYDQLFNLIEIQNGIFDNSCEVT